jgi:hypothetical protein
VRSFLAAAIPLQSTGTPVTSGKIHSVERRAKATIRKAAELRIMADFSPVGLAAPQTPANRSGRSGR